MPADNVIRSTPFMKIRFRLILLLGCLLAVFAAATWLLRASHHHEATTIHASMHEQRGGLLDRLLVLTGQSLHSFANDYALWDEMVAFVGTGDRAWARINIDASLVNFGAQGAWVLRPDGSQIYRAGNLGAPTEVVLPFATSEFRQRLARERTMHFFLDTPDGLLEVRAAAILPSDDLSRQTEARGWWIVARLWSDSHLRTLAETLQSRVTLAAPAPPAAAPAALESAVIHLDRTFRDWTGRPVRALQVDYESLALARLLEGNVDETLVLVIFGAAMLTVTGAGLSRWVLAPLHQLGQSLESGRPEPLQALRRKQNEFGHLARLVEQSFSQRTTLEGEVAERIRMARTLQETETHLRESLELRRRLARDLHDGIIQSIYAAGLGLEGVRSTLRADPGGADERLAHCQLALNDTIRDVRTFIYGLEAEAAPVRPFRQTLATLVTTMQSVQPSNISLAVDDTVAARISPGQETQLLQILRESISNALQHAAPRSIHVSLQAGPAGGAVLAVADDGRGFDPARPAAGGRGLTNLGIRAREMGGTLQIDSTPGQGTRITLHFNPTHLTCPP